MQIQIHHHPYGRHVDVFIFERQGKDDIFYTFNDGVLVEQRRDIGNMWPEDIHPTMKLPYSIYELFLEKLIKQAQNEGISTDTEDLLKGKLEATELHLSDMRQMSNRMLRVLAKEPFVEFKEKES